jgi:predicted nucleic acid-binding protein
MSTLVFDTSPLSHFARAERLGVLERLLKAYRCVAPRAVLDEIADGEAKHPPLATIRSASWLEPVHVDELPELRAFAHYAAILGTATRDVGEAAVLAWAEVHAAIAILDDRPAVRAAKHRNVEAHGTLWLIANGVRAELLTSNDASNLVDQLRTTEAWLPCSGSDFEDWARKNGLLP